MIKSKSRSRNRSLSNRNTSLQDATKYQPPDNFSSGGESVNEWVKRWAKERYERGEYNTKRDRRRTSDGRRIEDTRDRKRSSSRKRDRDRNYSSMSDTYKETNDQRGSIDFTLSRKSGLQLEENGKLEHELGISIGWGSTSFTWTNQRLGIGLSILGIGFSLDTANGGTLGVDLGIIGIESNSEMEGKLSYLWRLYEIEAVKEGCTYVKKYFIAGIYAKTEIQKIPGCGDEIREPKKTIQWEDFSISEEKIEEILRNVRNSGNYNWGNTNIEDNVKYLCFCDWERGKILTDYQRTGIARLFLSSSETDHGIIPDKILMLYDRKNVITNFSFTISGKRTLYDDFEISRQANVPWPRITGFSFNKPLLFSNRWEFSDSLRGLTIGTRSEIFCFSDHIGNPSVILGYGWQIKKMLSEGEYYIDRFTRIKRKGEAPFYLDSKKYSWRRVLKIELFNPFLQEVRKKTYYDNIPKPSIDMSGNNCFTENDRIILARIALATGAAGIYPVTTPRTLQDDIGDSKEDKGDGDDDIINSDAENSEEDSGEGDDYVVINSTPEYLTYLHGYLDQTLGQYPVAIQIPDIDPTTPGEQKSEKKYIPNISEVLAETYGLTLQESVNRADKRLEYGVAVEVEAIKMNLEKLKHDIEAIIDFLGFKDDFEMKTMNFPFDFTNPAKIMERFTTKVKMRVFKSNKDNPKLSTILDKLLISAQHVQKAFGIPVNPANVTGSLIDFFKGISGESEQDKLDRVKDLIESGKLSNDNIGIGDNPKLRNPTTEEKNDS